MLQKGHWNNLENRKQFLLEFARKMGFDPMVADNWRSQRYNINAYGVRQLTSTIE